MLEPLFTGDWASDQLSMIGSPGEARLLSAIEQRVDAGQGSAGLTQLLASMGVKYLVVRNDLDPSDLYGAWPARIHDALASSPGLTEVATFGNAQGREREPGQRRQQRLRALPARADLPGRPGRRPSRR